MTRHLSDSVQRLLLLGLLLWQSLANAENRASTTYGIGPNKYDFYELKASADLGKLPLSIDLRNFSGRSEDEEIINEVEWGLTWLPTDWITLDFHRQTAQAPSMDVEANKYRLSLNLAALWEGELDTLLDFGYSRISYDPSARPAAKAALTALLPETDRYSIGVTKDLTKSLSIAASYDDYRHSRDPVDVAVQLLRRLRRPNTGIFQIIAFPDRANSFSAAWKPLDPLKLELSNDRTYTVIDQKLNSTRLDLSYKLGKTLTLGAAATRSKSGEIKRRGNVVQEETAGNYYEINADFSF